MRSSRRTQRSLKSSAQQLTNHNIGTELTTAWQGLAPAKAALRHIENHLEAVPGTGVLLDSVMDPPKEKLSRAVRDGQQAGNGGSSKRRGRSQWSPEKSSSRSPLRNTTQDSNVCRNICVEFKEPLATYREATPPPHPSSQLESHSMQWVPGSSYTSPDPLRSQLLYQRDTRDKQSDRDLDSTLSSALANTEVRYLNDQPALDTLRGPLRSGAGGQEERTRKAQLGTDSQESSPRVGPAPGFTPQGESSPSTSPGSAAQRLENLRRHQPDDKLEKLKERIRRQRQHLEEAAEREKLLSFQEQPIMAAVGTDKPSASCMPTAKIRKVALAPPAPMYKGFNNAETKIQTPDGKVWKGEDFHNLSRELYRDLSRQLAEGTRPNQQQQQQQQQQREPRADRSKERRPPKPVRKVHRAAPASDLNAKPVISPASWRDGQKLVKMVLGPVPKLPKEEDRSHPADSMNRAACHHHSASEPSSKSSRRSRPNSTERPRSGSREQSQSHSATPPRLLTEAQDMVPARVSTDLLSVDIQGILDDLQLDRKMAEKEERARQRSRGGSVGRRGRGGSGSRTRTPVSAWGSTLATGGPSRGCRSASPTTRRAEAANTADTGPKKRHYDADAVRLYITRQQEERKRRQAEDRKAMREEAERRNQRLQELYRKQRGAARTGEAPVAPVQKRLQETYNKLLLEEAQLGEEVPQMQRVSPPSQMRPMYLPSGESDKENKRLDAPQSPSSSDRSLNDPPPPLSRTDLDDGVATFLQPDRLSPAVRPTTGPFEEHLLAQLLRLETEVAMGNTKHSQRPATEPTNRAHSKLSRIEAIKATAASLSNRIESEARKFAGDGINYGAATSVDMDTALAPRPFYFDDGCWAGTPATVNNDVASRVQRVLTSTGRGSTAHPGAGDLHVLRGQKEKGTHTHSSNRQIAGDVPDALFNNYTQDKGRAVNGLEKADTMDKITQRRGYDKTENRMDLHDSSAGSISEGPILSEGSFSEEEGSPPHPPSSRVSRPADRLEAVDYRAGQRRDYQRLSDFQREAARCSAHGSPFAQQDSSKAAWEELNRGSPLSVINIFTKNLHGHVKASERNSPSAQSANGDAAVYEDDFVSSHSSRATGKLRRSSKSPSVNIHFEELMRRSPYEKSTGGLNSHHSSFQSSSAYSPQLSSGSVSGSSPLSKHSTKKRGTTSDQSDGTLVEEQRSSCSPQSEALSYDSRKRGSDKSSGHSEAKSIHSSDTLGESSGHFHHSLEMDGKKSSVAMPKHASPLGSPDSGSPAGADSSSEAVRGGSEKVNAGTTTCRNRVEPMTPGELQYSPAVLQQRMVAELHYLESVEESVRQLGDMERVMGVSMAQQDSASLAQMLKAKQQRHERDLYELKIKAEREALEAQLQVEENRQRVARAHIDLQESLAANQKETLEGLQGATTKMMSQQAEAARYTAEAARHIKEMTELARSQMPGALVVTPVANGSSVLEERERPYTKQQPENADSDSFQSEVSNTRTRPDETLSSLHSLSHSDSLSSRRPDHSGANTSSHNSPSYVSSDHREATRKAAGEGKRRKEGADGRTDMHLGSSSIEEEVPTAANDSICSDSIASVVDEKGDGTSVATENSLKIDESMTEDEIEERSFRSLLPSEAHRRGTMERKSRNHEESEEDVAGHNATFVSGAHNLLKPQDANMSFSGGQDSFSQFTMDMVRQYMRDEEVRLQHQSSLLRLRQKAVKEKTRTELAWLEHQRKRLRDKGEDDKMPPIRKKQRGLLMKLQQEQAEIRRLQEANKAARKERQLLLKQQEEIERMRNSTLRLKERLKCAGGEAPPETPVSETSAPEPVSSNARRADDNRSPSPSLSISGSETSSIMQKLKKMRTQMDEKHCSPVHYFFSVFTAQHWASLSVCLPNLHPKFQLFIYNQLVRFLTKREQQLMQRRRHAEELLQWKQRLDMEEAEVRRMEKEALAVWDRTTPQDKHRDGSESQRNEVSHISPGRHRSSEPRNDSEKDDASEGGYSSATPESSIHTEGLESQQPGSPSPARPVSVTPLPSIQSSPANYTQDFSSASPSPSRQSSIFKGSHSPAASPSDGSSKTKMPLHSSSRNAIPDRTRPPDFPVATQTEPISDQSDIEGRINALKDELRKRKFMAYQLKKEQKKRQKERLKAKEASLLKELETYNNFIEKTKAELNKEPDSTPTTSVPEQSSVKAPSHSSENNQVSRTKIDASLDHNASPEVDHSRSTSMPEELSDDDPPTVTPSPVHGSPVPPASGLRSLQSSVDDFRPSSKEIRPQITECGDNNFVSGQRSEIQKELEFFKLQKEDGSDSGEQVSTFKKVSSSEREKRRSSPPEAEGVQKPSTKSHWTPNVVQTSPHPSSSSASITSSRFPVSVAIPSEEEAPLKAAETSSPFADGYRDDFRSSADPSPREQHHSSKPESQISVSPTDIQGSREDSPSRATPYDSPDEELEEEIAEELSHRSGSSEPSHRSGRLLDLNKQTQDIDRDNGCIGSGHSQRISPSQSPLSPVIDEMQSFTVGDRVLVGSVQPGTLRFKGSTSFANGYWAGVELDKSEGSNNGTYDGVVYFECDDCHGIFAPPDKITHLPDKFEVYTDNTEDEDSFLDDRSDKVDKCQTDENENDKNQGNRQSEQTSQKSFQSEHKTITEDSLNKNQPSDLKTASHLNSQHHKESKHPISNGNAQEIIWDFDETPTTLLIPDVDTIGQRKEITTQRKDVHSLAPSDLIPVTGDVNEREKDMDVVDTFTDELFHNFVKDTVKQFAEIKKSKEQKIQAANHMNGERLFTDKEGGWISSVEQKDGLPFFPPLEKEELSSPELCNRPESPVLGASGQEELAKRLAELELSRELLEELGDDQDWFDEDYGLSSRREQQRQKQEEEELRSGLSAGAPMGGLVSSPGGEQPAKSPPRPELPLPLPPKLPEQPAMVVPHTASEVEKMVHAATREIWESFSLGREGAVILAQLPNPQPSQEYLGKEADSQDQEALSIRSYKKGVYDLTWEMLLEIYAEDPNADQPQWVKARRVKASFHRVKTPGDVTKIQAFITAEVLKLYGLTKDESQKTDWQKMLKFGRKKRDRVDHILVQELHEEEAQWVNYDEDEMFVKMQLADSIFEALLKDTADALTLICDKRGAREAPS